VKVEVYKPDTVQFYVSLEKEDELHTSCMWARITFDNKSWSMMAQSDCGDYSYSWVPEKDRTFLKLMQQIDGEYLLGKISDRSRFDEEGSKKNLLHWLDQEEDIDRLEKKIKEVNANSSEEFMREVKGIEGLEDCLIYGNALNMIILDLQRHSAGYLQNVSSQKLGSI